MTGQQRKETWPKYCCRMPSVRLYLCAKLLAVFSPSVSLTSSSLIMDFYETDSIKVALSIGNCSLLRKLLFGGQTGKSLHCSVCPNAQLPISNPQSNLNHISYTLPQTDTLHSAWAGFCLMLSIAFLCYSVQCTWLTRLIKNWFMPSVRISSYGCTWEVWRAWERRTCTSCNRGASLASWVLYKLSKCIHNSIYAQIRAWTYSFTPYILANKNAFFISCKILVPRRTEK